MTHLLSLARGSMLLATLLATVAFGFPRATVLVGGEAESPREERDQESVETIFSLLRRVHVLADHRGFANSRSTHDRGRHSRLRPCDTQGRDGHRLSNGLLAPLIC